MPKLLFLFLLFASFAAAQTRTPVLVELFTSEGCSSCPPADQLLFRLEQQPVAGADIIVLGEHVDYWDQLGWRDRFSSSRFTDRQQNYARHFSIDGPYTPQMVINGRSEFVGNESDRALRTIAAEAKASKTIPQISLVRDGDHLNIAVTTADRRPLNVLYAITEGNLSTKVRAGENGGHELRHTAVVHQLTKLGATRDGRFEARLPLPISSDWRPDNLHAVVFLQKGNAGEIAGATQIPLK